MHFDHGLPGKATPPVSGESENAAADLARRGLVRQARRLRRFVPTGFQFAREAEQNTGRRKRESLDRPRQGVMRASP